MQKLSPLALLALAAAIVFLAASNAAWAAEPVNNSVDKIVDLYRDHASRWQTTLAGFALRLFWILAAIEFTVSAFWLAVRGADLGEWLAELLKQVLFIGFFAALLSYSSQWAGAIVGSFRQAANEASQASSGLTNIAPSDVFDSGLQIAGKIMDQSSWYAPGTTLGLVLAALVVLVCFALITGFMVLALVESYIVISAGVLFMGFGGSQWTKDFAVRTLVYAVSVGAKLFVLQLVVGLGYSLFKDLAANFGTTNTDIFIVIGSAIVMLALTLIIPDMVQGLINGSSTGSGMPLIRAGAMAAGAAVAGATAVAGGGMAVRSARNLAGEQLASAETQAGSPRSRAARWLYAGGQTLNNLAQAAAANTGARLSGQAHFGTWSGQMAAAMDREAENLKGERLKPRPPGSSQEQTSARGPSGNTIRGSGHSEDGTQS